MLEILSDLKPCNYAEFLISVALLKVRHFYQQNCVILYIMKTNTGI